MCEFCVKIKTNKQKKICQKIKTKTETTKEISDARGLVLASAS